MTRFPYSCHSAKRDLQTLMTLLRRERVLAEDIFQPQLDAFVAECTQCKKDLRAKHCRGWCVSIGAERALVFEPTEYKQRLVRPLLHGTCDFRRPTAGTGEEWEDAPLAQSTVVVLLFEGVEIEEPSERHHLDLANEHQPGPVWHLQLGGTPAGMTSSRHRGLGRLAGRSRRPTSSSSLRRSYSTSTRRHSPSSIATETG